MMTPAAIISPKRAVRASSPADQPEVLTPERTALTIVIPMLYS
jgi:hypothetical protein